MEDVYILKIRGPKMNWAEATAAMAAGVGILAILYKIVDTHKKGADQGVPTKFDDLGAKYTALDVKGQETEKDLIVIRADLSNLENAFGNFKIEVKKEVSAVHQNMREDLKDLRLEVKEEFKSLNTKFDSVIALLLKERQ